MTGWPIQARFWLEWGNSRFFPSIITRRNIRLIRVWYPGPLDLNQSTTSQSTRNEILCFRGRFQRGSACVSPPASQKRSSSIDPCSRAIFSRRDCGIRRFVFLTLAVMTLLYARSCHDAMFLQEHSGQPVVYYCPNNL
jgi:hypothetical protein